VYKRQYLTLIAKYVCLNCNLNGDGDPRWGFIPAGNGDGEEMLPASVRGELGIPAGKFFRRGDGDGELFPGGEFPVAIPTSNPSGFVAPKLVLYISWGFRKAR
jgi:hypothetical protein